MKRLITTGILASVIALSGCATNEKYGDARLVMKRNLMKAMALSNADRAFQELANHLIQQELLEPR